MKAVFEIDFADGRQARQALKAMQFAGKSKRAQVHVTLKKGNGRATIIYTISADSFSALRARATSLLRDVKVAKDAFAVVGRKGGLK